MRNTVCLSGDSRWLTISTAAFSGKQWLFIAARSKGVVAIDISDPNAASPTIKVWEHLYTTTFERTEVGGVIALAGADHPQLLVFAYGKKKVALVNADTGVVESERDLPLVGPIVSFSGGSAYIAGGIPDTGRDGVWLATTDGYGFLARAGLAWDTTQLYAVQAPHMLAENLGGDVPHGILFSPNYARPVGGGVQLVDLTARKSYYMLDSAFSVAFRTRGLRQPDAGSVDGIYQVGIITNEDTPDVGFINLATIVKTDGSPMNTFTGGTGGTTYVKIANSLELSGSAVESSTHLALFMAGFSVSIAVGRVQDPTTTPWNGLTDWRYLPTVPNYLYSRDPHAVAAILNTFNNKAYGYLLDGSFRKAVQIDLAAFLAVAPAGTTGDSLHLIPASVDLDTTRVLKRFNW